MRSTRSRGLSQVYGLVLMGPVLFGAASPSSAGAPAAASRLGAAPSDVGQWSAPIDIGIVGIHAVLLHTGSVLFFELPAPPVGGSKATLFDPVTMLTQRVDVPGPRDIFCGAQSVMPDGRVLVTGGMKLGFHGAYGTRAITIFDPGTSSWTNGPSMAYPRYYPTNLQMPDGTTLVVTGKATPTQLNPTTEQWDPTTGTITMLPRSAASDSAMYARMFVIGDGSALRVGPNQMTARYDPSSLSWSDVSPMNYGPRYQGSAILLDDLHRILTAGGERTEVPTGTAEIFDTWDPSAGWRYTSRMNRARMHTNLVGLPDGTVLAVGGNQLGHYDMPVKDAELYDPANETWTLMAAQSAQRGYHSTALLLPDARVLSAGSDDGDLQTTVEFYSPPYLFRGPRPVIAGSPASIGYGQPFDVVTPDASTVRGVVLIRPGSATHAVDFDQRRVPLKFSAGAGILHVEAPASGNTAPPGWYMLFLVNDQGVPSVAMFVQVGVGSKPRHDNRE